MIDFDDKDIAIISLTVIAIVTLIVRPDAADRIITAIVSAIAGFVTGRKLSSK